jgi:uncharacterized membrane protein YfhO
MEGLPFLYCGVLTVVMLMCFFVCGKISARKRIAGAFLLGVMFTCMYITPVDMVWHGGQLPNWLPYRYSFVIIFLMVSFGAQAFDEISGISRKTIGVCASIFLALMMYLESQDTFMKDLGDKGREVLDGISVIMPAVLVLFIVTSLVILGKKQLSEGADIAKRFPKRDYLSSLQVSLCILIIGELFYNTAASIDKQDVDVVYSTRDSYVNEIIPMRQVVDGIKAKDPGFYRIEKEFYRTVNDPMAIGAYGLSHSSSTMNAKVLKMMENFGIISRSHYSDYLGATPVTDDLFGIKYILTCPDNNAMKATSADAIKVNENPDAMPVAYLVNPMIDTLDFDKLGDAKMNVFGNQNLVLSDMLGLDEIANFIETYPQEDLLVETENVAQGYAVGNYISYKVETKGKNAQLKYTFTVAEDGEQYMWIPSEYERKLNVWVNGVWKGNYFEVSNYYVKKLGDFKKGDKVSVILTLTKDDLYIKERVYFGYINQKLYRAAINGLHEMNENTVVNRVAPAHLQINTNRNEEDILFTTIPIEPGWIIKIDGQPVNTDALFIDSTPNMIDKIIGRAAAWEKAKNTINDIKAKNGKIPVNAVEPVFDSLIGIRLSPGAHTVDMEFIPNYYPFAWILSASGFAILIILSVIQAVYDRKHKNTVSPENIYGEQSEDVSDEQPYVISVNTSEYAAEEQSESIFDEPSEGSAEEQSESVSGESQYDVAENTEIIAEEIYGTISPEPAQEEKSNQDVYGDEEITEEPSTVLPILTETSDSDHNELYTIEEYDRKAENKEEN